MKKIVLITIIFVVALKAKAQWTKSQEILFTSQAFNVGKSIGFTDLQSAQYAECCLNSFKARIPNPTDASQKQGYDAGLIAGRECMEKLNIPIKWTPTSEKLLKTKLEQIDELKILNDKLKEPLLDCVITKLKAKYPSGLSKMPDTEYEKIWHSCIDELVKAQ